MKNCLRYIYIFIILFPIAATCYLFTKTCCCNNKDLNKRNKHTGRTQLINAILSKDFKATMNLLNLGANVNTKDGKGINAISYASKLGFSKAIVPLIHRGADVNSRTYVSGYTPLHEAASSGNLQTIHDLLKLGANKSARTDDEYSSNDCLSPYEIALHKGNKQAASILKPTFTINTNNALIEVNEYDNRFTIHFKTKQTKGNPQLFICLFSSKNQRLTLLQKIKNSNPIQFGNIITTSELYKQDIHEANYNHIILLYRCNYVQKNWCIRIME